MTLEFETYTSVSLDADGPLGGNHGYRIVESKYKDGAPFNVNSGYDNYQKEDVIKLGSDPKTVPGFVTEGDGHKGNKLVPSEKAIMTASTFEIPQSRTVEKEFTVKDGWFGSKKEMREVQEELPPKKGVVVQFDMDSIDYSGRHAGSTVAIYIEEPKDTKGKKEFAELVEKLGKFGEGRQSAIGGDGTPDILIPPTVINTRDKQNPDELRANALAGLIERTNKVVRGTLDKDSTVTLTPDQLINLLKNEVNQVSTPVKEQSKVQPAQTKPTPTQQSEQAPNFEFRPTKQAIPAPPPEVKRDFLKNAKIVSATGHDGKGAAKNVEFVISGASDSLTSGKIIEANSKLGQAMSFSGQTRDIAGRIELGDDGKLTVRINHPASGEHMQRVREALKGLGMPEDKLDKIGSLAKNYDVKMEAKKLVGDAMQTAESKSSSTSATSQPKKQGRTGPS